MDVTQFWWQSAAAPAGIGNSLRFRGAQYLAWTPAADGNRKTWTWSGWVKRGPVDTPEENVFGVEWSTGRVPSNKIGFGGSNNSSQIPSFSVYLGSGSDLGAGSPGVARDPAAWMHFVAVWDTTNATESERMRFFINGVQQPRVYGNPVSQNTDGSFNTATLHRFSGGPADGRLFQGYLAETHFIDGQALDATTFGQFNADGVWVPKKFTGAHGTNGFYLDFSDPADIGADRSGNGNNFTATGFELTDTSSRAYDWAVDSPTNNIGSINTVTPASYTDAQGTFHWQHATTTSTSTWRQRWRPLAVQLPTTGKYFVTSVGVFETEQSASRRLGGLYILDDQDFTFNANNVPTHGTGLSVGESSYARYIRWAVNGTIGANITRPSNFRNHTLCLAYDADTRKVWVGWADQHAGTTINWIDSSGGLTGNPAAGTNETGTVSAGVIKPTVMIHAAVQQAGTSGNANSYGVISDPVALWQNRGLTAPAGFEPLSTATLPAVAITNPSDHFTTITDTGANILTAAQAKFPNGLWWIKDRANSNQHQLVDSVRGGNLALQCPANGQETAYAAPAGNSVAWCWNVGGAPVANTDGTIPSQVSANKAAGFSIVTYTGTQVPSTVGHGLDAAPEMIIAKRRNNSSPFDVYHTRLTSASYRLQLSSNSAQSISNGSWNGTDPTDTVFSVKDDIATNRLNDQHVAYCWHSVPGYSSIGKYVGNANADGPFIYTGFKVGWLMIRRADSTENWLIFDTVRKTYNPVNDVIWANLTSTEAPNYLPQDLLSNGFKIRTTSTSTNASGGNYIYMAFAEHPFGGSNVSPSPAR